MCIVKAWQKLLMEFWEDFKQKWMQILGIYTENHKVRQKTPEEVRKNQIFRFDHNRQEQPT